jgi:hypothetical protein
VSKKQLLETIREQAAQLKKRDEQIEALQNENALLRQKLDLLIRKVFGPSSEKLDPAQLEMSCPHGCRRVVSDGVVYCPCNK